MEGEQANREVEGEGSRRQKMIEMKGVEVTGMDE